MRIGDTQPWVFLLLAACLAAPAFATPAPQETAGQGLVVEDVAPEGAAARAGIAPGDVLLTWERAAAPPANPQPASGRLSSPFDLAEVEHEEAPRGALRFSGLHEETARVWEIPLGKWGLIASPRLRGRQLGEYRRGQQSIVVGKVAAGVARWRRLAKALAESEPERAAWLLQRVAKVQQKNGAWTDARATYETILSSAGQRCTSVAVSQVQARLGMLLGERGELKQAADHLLQAIAIRRALAPASLTEAAFLEELGHVRYLQGDLRSAEQLLTEALTLEERLAPGGARVASGLSNLGIVERHLGNLSVAEDLQHRSMEIDKRLVPDSLDIAADLTNLSALEDAHGDYPAALDDIRAALALRQKVDPESLDVANSMVDAGSTILRLGGDPASAAALFERSLELRKRLHASEFDLVQTLTGLGAAAGAQHQYAAAEQWLKQALAIQEKALPGALYHAEILSNLASLILEEGRLKEAEDDSRHALKIFRELAPETEREAMAYRDLAVIIRRAGRLSEASELYEQALRSLETAAKRLFGSGQRLSTFLASHAPYYREAIDLLIELGRPEEAFSVLERYRARGLLALLAERELNLADEIPAQLESERRSANAEYESVLGQFAKLSAASPKKDWEVLQARLTEARRRQDFVRERIRAASPRLAGLRDPEPLDLAATARALDSGTVLLSYMVGEERSYLFVVGPGADHFAVYPIKTGQKALGEEVHRLRNLIEQGGDAARPQALLGSAGPLTSLLLTPAASEIAASQRLLVVPDGPLHVLPFAILADPAGPRFLIESKPIHTAASATVFAELKNLRESRPTRLSAFGDPIYPASGGSAPTDLALRAAQREGLRFDPLPGSRAEVEALGALFPSASQIYLGAAATEEHAKALGRETTIVHFACHALLNQRFPLDSALVLSIPENPGEGQDNGLLQAWEIFEQVHLDADLVTLSACESALGKEQGGEGLIGLTRAFQYAGARTVLASLWSVADTGAAELMKRFYGYLKTGASKDEALRHAQADLLQGAGGSELSNPFHWAAFELIGDWK